MTLIRSVVFSSLLIETALFTVAITVAPSWVPDTSDLMDMADNLTDVAVSDPKFDAEKEIPLKLYTLKNPTTPQYIQPSSASNFSWFDSKKPTRFIIHGWRSGQKQFQDMIDAYMNRGFDYNIVMVDWSARAKESYPSSKATSRRVGEYLAQVIRYLEKNSKLSLDNVHIIGHSLGAQAAGIAGNELNGKIARIVGLDPAAPLFGSLPTQNRLDLSDAKFVQIIHTNAGKLGWNDTLGHMDVFPNGGSVQEGCWFDITGSCSHSRSVQLFTESITSKNIIATNCNSYELYEAGKCNENNHISVGEWAPSTATGSYYLKTNDKSPFALGVNDPLNV